MTETTPKMNPRKSRPSQSNEVPICSGIGREVDAFPAASRNTVVRFPSNSMEVR
jgi:hypothetical protein